MNRFNPLQQVILLMILAGVLVALACDMAFPFAWPTQIDAGIRDARFTYNFHEPEQFGDTIFRWTTGDSQLRLPRPPVGTALLTLRLLNGYPDSQPDPMLTITTPAQAIGTFAVTRRTSGVRRYHLLLPTNDGFSWDLPLNLQSSTFTPANDQRALGVVLDWVQIHPTGSIRPFPPLFPLVMAFLLGALLFLLSQLLGLRIWVGAVAVACVAVALAVGIILRPLEILPFIQRLAALPAIGLVGIMLVRLLVPLQRDAQRNFTVQGSDLPILFAIAWWLLPLFQAFQILDGASIGVGVETFWLAGIASLLLLVSVTIGWWRGRSQKIREQRRSIANVALIGLAAGATLHLSYAIWYAFTRTGKDFWILFKGARDWVRGGSLYDLEAVMTNHVGAVFKVPPFYGMLFTPFVFQDGLEILFYHRLINIGLMIATALVCLAIYRVQPRWWGVAVFLILLNSRPLADTIAYGQIDLMLMFLLSCALWAMRKEWDGWAGALIALATLFKVYPVIILAFLVLKGRWRGLIGFALGMLAYNGIAIAVMGWEMHRVYLFEVIPRIGGTTSWVENQTISGFLARLTDAPFDAHIFENRALSMFGTALSGLVSLYACWLSLRPAEGKSTAFALQYAQYLLLMVLAVPAAWMHYETLLVLVFGILLMHLRERNIRLGSAAALALSFALISYGNQWSFNGTTVMGLLTILGISYKFYGMLILGAVMVGCLRQEPAPVALPFLPRLTLRTRP